ncbi:MAG: trigger factor [Thermoanaerobaculum sp.]|nr:trigger factor [Thermoanaerobaculum sp.]MDW7966663.1 trigger factor [Thermoanaerobaculum sp.]
MTYELERPSPCLVRLKGTVSAATAEKVRQEVIRGLARHAVLPGFRPGKAPLPLVATRFSEEIRRETEERLFRQLWDQAVAQEGFRVAGPLGVLEARWEEGGGLSFTGEFEIYPPVTLPALEGFQPPQVSVEPTEEEVEAFLQGLAERQATWEGIEEGRAEDGMLVEAEVEGHFPEGGGDPFREELAMFRLGAGEVFPEIEAAVRGLAVGEETKARREVVREGEKGAVPVQYTLRVKGLRRKVVPALDDELAVRVGVEGGLEGLREQARVALRQGKKRERAKAIRQAFLAYLAGDGALPLPQRLVEEETQKAAVRYAESLHRQGVDVGQLNWQELAPRLRASVEQRLREELLLDRLAEQLGVEVAEAEVDEVIRREAQETGVPFAELKGNLAKRGGLEKIQGILRRERALAQVLGPWLGEG